MIYMHLGDDFEKELIDGGYVERREKPTFRPEYVNPEGLLNLTSRFESDYKPEFGFWGAPFAAQIQDQQDENFKKGIVYSWERFWTDDYKLHKIMDVAEKGRNHAIYFEVDDSKILSVSELEDIKPFVKGLQIITYNETNDYDNYQYIKGRVDFDAIRDAGYSGVDLRAAEHLHETEMFRFWDVNSIVIWEPSCVRQIDQEIAYIARMDNGTYTKFDQCDPKMDVDYLSKWVCDNQSKVKAYVQKGVVTQETVDNLLVRKYDRKYVSPLENAIDDIDRNSTKYKIAKYCYDNDLLPYYLTSGTLIRERDGVEMSLFQLVKQPRDDERYVVKDGVCSMKSERWKPFAILEYSDVPKELRMDLDSFLITEIEGTLFDYEFGHALIVQDPRDNVEKMLSTVDFTKEYEAVVQDVQRLHQQNLGGEIQQSEIDLDEGPTR